MGKSHNEVSSPGREGRRRKAFQRQRSLNEGKKTGKYGKKLKEEAMDLSSQGEVKEKE